MYGKTVTLTNGFDTISIFILGVPSWTDEQWEKQAKRVIDSMSIKS